MTPAEHAAHIGSVLGLATDETGILATYIATYIEAPLEAKLKSSRLVARVHGLLDGFDAAAPDSLKESEAELSKAAEEIAALRTELAASASTACRLTAALERIVDVGYPVQRSFQIATEALARSAGPCPHATELSELQALLDLQRTRVQVATALWQTAHPDEPGVFPDLGKLVDWLVERGDEVARLRKLCGEAELELRDFALWQYADVVPATKRICVLVEKLRAAKKGETA